MKLKLILWLGISGFVLTACSEQEAQEQVSQMKVSVVQAKSDEWIRTLTLSGNVVAKEDVAISTPLQGLQVLEVKAEIGDWVEKGQVLAELEHSSVQSQLAQNEAALNGAKANLIAQEATLREAEATLKRYQTLMQSESVSRVEFDQQKVKAQTAKAAVQAAKAEIVQLQAQLNDNRHQRTKTQVVAPASGLITQRAVESGSLTKDEVLFHLAKNGELEILSEVNRDEVALLRTGLNADFQLGTQLLPGTLRLISPEIDAASRLAKIRIQPIEPPIKPVKTAIGTDVAVKLHLAPKAVAVSIPFSAVSFDNQGQAFTKVVNLQNKVEKRAITLGVMHQSAVEILTGLQTGEQVIKQAGAFVDEGDVIEPILE